MKSCVYFVLVAVAITFASGVEEHGENHPPVKASWDFFVFSQQWPETVCKAWKDRSSKNECNIPKAISSWSAHGLWPSMNTGEGPQFCNQTWKFNMTELDSIMTDLEVNWPNLYKGTSLESFWEHEWTKHGTCAASDPLINTELKYFSTGLKLVSKYNLFQILSDAGITPSPETSYQLDAIHNVFQNSLSVEPTITCYRDKESHKYLIKEIRICLTKELSLIECPQPSRPQLTDDEDCSKDGVTYYPLIIPTAASKAEL